MATFRKQASGKWTAEVCVQGVRKSKTWDSKARAKSWAAEVEYEIKQQAGGTSHTHTLADVFDRYADEVSSRKRGARWEIVRLNKFKSYPISRVKLIDLRRENFEQWIDGRLANDNVMSSTVNRELNLMSHCLTQARRWRLMSSKPMDDLQRPRNPPHRDRRVSPDEQERILIALGYSENDEPTTSSKRVGVAFLLALETAMRRSEICKIRTADINFEHRTVFLPETKNGASRFVPLSQEAVRLIERLGTDKEDAILGVSPDTLSTLFRKAAAMAGVEDITFHDSRHEAITRLASRFDVLDLARIVGHRDIKQLMTYYNKSAADLAKQFDD